MVGLSLIGLSAIALVWAVPAQAHDSWTDGSSVPAWVKAQCCGIDDVHHLSPDQVHRTDSGYRVDGYPRLIADDRLMPSHDGDWWVFYKDFGGGRFSDVYCFFGPLGF